MITSVLIKVEITLRNVKLRTELNKKNEQLFVNLLNRQFCGFSSHFPWLDLKLHYNADLPLSTEVATISRKAVENMIKEIHLHGVSPVVCQSIHQCTVSFKS